MMISPIAVQLRSGLAIAQAYRVTNGPLAVLVIGDPTGRIQGLLSTDHGKCAHCPSLGEVLRQKKPLVTDRAVRTSDVVDGSTHFDLVIALDGWDRLLEVTQPVVRDEALAWLREHCTFMLTSAPRRPLAPDLNELGPYEVHSLFANFAYVSELPKVSNEPESSPPLLMASDWFLQAGQVWIPWTELHQIPSHVEGPSDRSGRTYMSGAGHVVKVDFVSSDYFERSQVIGEAAFLASASSERRRVLQLPEIRSIDHGRAIVTLVRDRVRADTACGLDPVAAVNSIIDEARRYSSVGLFHNDLRPWNVLWQNGRAILIDFADTAEEDLDARDLPQVLALAGTCAALLTKQIRAGVHFHTDVVSIATRAGILDWWPLQQQYGLPWFRLCQETTAVPLHHGQSAAQVMRQVLEASYAV